MTVESRYLNQDIFIIEVDTEAASVVIFNGDAPCAFRVIDVWAIGTPGASSDTVKITDGTNDITDAIDVTAALVGRAGTIDDAYWDIAAGGSLSAVVASALDATVFIMCQKRNP